MCFVILALAACIVLAVLIGAAYKTRCDYNEWAEREPETPEDLY